MDRWSELFADLGAQWSAYEAAELEGEVLDRARIEAGTVGLADRLRASLGTGLTVRAGGTAFEGTLDAVGADWLLLAGDGIDALVPLAMVDGLTGLQPGAMTDELTDSVDRRLTLSAALRELARRRAPVTVHAADGAAVHGTIDRVGRDYLELAEHAVGEPRRASAVRGLRVVPVGRVTAVLSR